MDNAGIFMPSTYNLNDGVQVKFIDETPITKAIECNIFEGMLGIFLFVKYDMI